MWDKIFSSAIGKVLSAVILVFLGFLGAVSISYWNTKVASPKFVEQKVLEVREELETNRKLEDQEIRKSILSMQEKDMLGQQQLFNEIREMNKNQAVFQAQVKGDLNYLKSEVSSMKIDTKEEIRTLDDRVRQIEAGK